MVVDRFKELLNEFCTEPQEEEILGSFLAISPHDDIDEQPRTVPEKKKKEDSETAKSSKISRYKDDVSGTNPTPTRNKRKGKCKCNYCN